MAVKAWFNYNTYMDNKLIQIQAAEPNAGWTAPSLKAAFEKAGFAGDTGAQAHFLKYGHSEDVSPNSLFNATYYYQAKAIQYYTSKEAGSEQVDEATVKGDLAAYGAKMEAIIKGVGMDAWTHYTKYGTKEGINPSNDFDTSSYMEAKIKAMNGSMTADEVYAAFKKAGFNALMHEQIYAGKGGANEVTTTSFPVPEDEQFTPDGDTGDTFTLTSNDAVLTATTSSNVSPAGKMTDGDQTIEASNRLGTALIQDPSTSDNDVLNATITEDAVPTLENIETIKASLAGGDFDVSSVTGTKRIELTTTKENAVTGVDTTASDAATFALVGGSKDITFEMADLTDDKADALNLEVNGWSGKITLDAAAGKAGGLELLNFASEGEDANDVTLAATAPNVTKIGEIVFSGKAGLNLTAAHAAVNGAKLNASGAEGGLNLIIDRDTAGTAVTNAANFTGVKAITLIDSTAGTDAANINNLESGTTVTFGNNFAAASTLTVKGAGSSKTDELTVVLDNVKDATDTKVDALTIANVETINVEADGAKKVDTLGLTADSATAVKISGDSALDLTLTAVKATSIEATNEGNLTLKLGGTLTDLASVKIGEGDGDVAFSISGTLTKTGKEFAYDGSTHAGDQNVNLTNLAGAVDGTTKATVTVATGSGKDVVNTGAAIAATNAVQKYDLGAGDDEITIVTNGGPQDINVTLGDGQDTVKVDLSTAITSGLTIADFGADDVFSTKGHVASIAFLKDDGQTEHTIAANNVYVLTTAVDGVTSATLKAAGVTTTAAGAKAIVVACNNESGNAEVYAFTGGNDTDVTNATVNLIGTFENIHNTADLAGLEQGNFSVFA